MKFNKRKKGRFIGSIWNASDSSREYKQKEIWAKG
jgi:hypothetical protein